jgi:hypothetical protein
MKKLTPDQRQYRKRKKEAKKDFIRINREDGGISVRVAKRPLCVRVSADVFDALTAVAQAYQLDKGEMLTHMINHSIERYQGGSLSRSPTRRYEWPEKLLSGVDAKPKRNALGTEKQINLRISSTAYKKLECYCNDKGFSKKRAVQQLILEYVKDCSQEV